MRVFGNVTPLRNDAMKTSNSLSVQFLSIAVGALLLQALASQPLRPVVLSQPVPPERIHWTPEVSASAALATVHVIREARFMGRAMPTTLTIDGKEVAVIRNGENLMVRMPPGQYSLGLKYEGQSSPDPDLPSQGRQITIFESVLQLRGGKYHDLRIVPDERWEWQLALADH